MRALRVVAPMLLLSGCLGSDIPTQQVGGTLYGMPLAVPGATGRPRVAVTVHRTPRGVDSLTLTASLLKTLEAPARYQVYLVDQETGNTWPVSADIQLTRTDTTFSATGAPAVTTTVTDLGNQRFFEGVPLNTRARLRIRHTAGGDSIGMADFVVITIQRDSANPSFETATPKPFWLRFRPSPTETLEDSAMFFGTFDPVSPRVFIPQGTGRSGFWDRHRDGRLVYSAIATNLAQPPIGYYYQPVVRDTRTGRAAAFGELRDSLGASLKDADLRPITGTFAQLPKAFFGAPEDSIPGRWVDYTHVQLVLQPKTGVTTFPGTMVTLQGNIPDTLAVRRTTGVISALVLQGTTPVEGATVNVYRAGSTSRIDFKTTNSEGRAVIGGIPAETVDIRVVPPAGFTSTAPAQLNLQVPAGDTLQVTFNLP